MLRRNIGASESSLVYILGLCAGSVVVSFLSRFLALGSFGGMDGMSWIAYALNQIAFLIVVFGYAWMRHVDIKSVAHIRKPRNPKQFIILPFLTIATIILFLPISDLFVKLLEVIGYDVGTVPMVESYNVGIYFLSLLVMAVMPALGEEFMMRGVLLGGLSTRSTWFGILVSALLFSLMHGSPLQTVYQFGLGIVLAIVMLMSGSIWMCVFIHFFNNFLTITMNSFVPQIELALKSIGYWTILTDVVSILVGAVLVVVCLYIFYRLGERKNLGYHAVTDGVVYEEFTIYATPEVKAENRRNKFSATIFAQSFRFFGSLFTRRGWMNVTGELRSKTDIPYVGKAQPMFNVWLAIGFAVFYWTINLIFGFVQ